MPMPMLFKEKECLAVDAAEYRCRAAAELYVELERTRFACTSTRRACDVSAVRIYGTRAAMSGGLSGFGGWRIARRARTRARPTRSSRARAPNTDANHRLVASRDRSRTMATSPFVRTSKSAAAGAIHGRAAPERRGRGRRRGAPHA